MSGDEIIIDDDVDLALWAGARRCNPIAPPKQTKKKVKAPKQHPKKKRVVTKKKGVKRGSTSGTVSSREKRARPAGRDSDEAAERPVRKRVADHPASGGGAAKGDRPSRRAAAPRVAPRPAGDPSRLPGPDRPSAPTPSADATGAIGKTYGDPPGDRGTASPPRLGLIAGNCFIPYENLAQSDINHIKESLTVNSPQRAGNEDEEGRKPLKLYRTHDQSVELPRAWTVAGFDPTAFDDGMSYGKPVEFVFHGQLDEKRHQVRIAREIGNAIRPGVGGIAQAPCGSGKTVLGLFAAARWGKTTAILVHTEFLADQWEERAVEFLHLKPDEIGRAQGDKCVYKGKKLVIVLTPSIASRALGKSKDYPNSFYEYFGACIADEVHRHAADTWHLAIGKFPAAYRLGLSATPTRADGMEQVIFHHFGPIISRTQEYQNKPKVYQILWDPDLNPKSFAKWKNGEQLKGKVNMARLINKLARDTKRNNMLAKQIAKAGDAGRKVFVLSQRLEQLESLLDLVYLELETSGLTLTKYIGGMSREERAEAAKGNIIFATEQLAAEALDIPDLDTLIMATPRSNVEQSIGRILREFDDKKDALVVDVVDNIPVCERMADRREKLYDDHGWEVIEVELA